MLIADGNLAHTVVVVYVVLIAGVDIESTFTPRYLGQLTSEPPTQSSTVRIYRHNDTDVIYSYLIYASWFFYHHDAGQALRNACYCDVTFVVR